MFSRPGIYVPIFALILLAGFFGCQENEGGTQNVSRINSIDEIVHSFKGIKFKLTLSDGRVVWFTPGNKESNSPGFNFSTPEDGFNFTNTNGFFEIKGSGYALLRVNGQELEYNSVSCLSGLEYDRIIKWYNLNPRYYDYTFIFVFSGTDDIEYLIDNDLLYGNMDHLFMVLTTSNELDYAYWVYNDIEYDLTGEAFYVDGTLNASGNARQFNTPISEADRFSLTLKCGE
jgi:hypothetical protein